MSNDNYDLSERQHKLLRLALDKAAQPGEWQTAANMFIKSLREAGVDCDTFLLSIVHKDPPIVHHLLRFVMPFGKHKGRMMADVDTDYLQWLSDSSAIKPGMRRALDYNLELRRKQQT